MSSKGQNKSHRIARIADQIQKELAVIIQRELKDPRIGMLTIIDVTVSSDLSHAEVYYTLLDDCDLKATQEGLEAASKFLRGALASSMKNLRIVPALKFHYDTTLARGNELSKLIDQAVASDKAAHPDSEKPE